MVMAWDTLGIEDNLLNLKFRKNRLFQETKSSEMRKGTLAKSQKVSALPSDNKGTRQSINGTSR